MTQFRIISFDGIGVSFALRDRITSKVIPERSIDIEAIAEILLGFGCFIHHRLNERLRPFPPLRWRLVGSDGTPVTDLTTASLQATSLACSDGTTSDLLEEIAAGSSGLLNLGNGYYQINWKAPKSYAGSCKTLHLDLGEGITRDALFRFPK